MSSAPLACGIWPGRKGLIAVLVDNSDGRLAQPPILAPTRSLESRWALLERIDGAEGLDWQLVVPDWLARADSVAELALSRGIVVWLAPAPLTESLRLLGHVSALPAHRCAAGLARLLAVPLLRAHLHCVRPADRRQLSLF